MVTMFWMAGYKGTYLISLNRCRLAHKAIFLSDLAIACGRFLDLMFLVPPDAQGKAATGDGRGREILH